MLLKEKIGRHLSILCLVFLAGFELNLSAQEADDVTRLNDFIQSETLEGTMLMQPTVERINPGINPEFFGYRIEGLILKGANDCLAMGAAVEIHSYIHGGVLYLVPTRVARPDVERVCPSLSQPIFELGHIDVRYSRKEVQKIVLRNVGQDLEDFAFVP